MVEKFEMENATYHIWEDAFRARGVAAATKKEAPLKYGVFCRWAEGSGSRVGNIEAWIASNTHYSSATKGSVL